MSVYSKMLTEGMEQRGHQVEIWQPKARLYRLPLPASFKKWMGYVDQFLLFPFEVRMRKKNTPDSIFVFCDNALGPWVPLVTERPHVIHCHDFLALNSGLGKIAEAKVSWTGRKYQDMIKNGLLKGKNFISVSDKTKDDLRRMLGVDPKVSEVVYNGLNRLFKPMDPVSVRLALSREFDVDLNNGYLMHLGGNLWYKNRKGVIEMYIEWRKITELKLPLIMIGEEANEDIGHLIRKSAFKNDIHILSGCDDNSVHWFYSGASLFLFPSLAEGFGWPIAEAMACGCPVITTSEAPMTEVGADAAYYIPRRPFETEKAEEWSSGAALIIEQILQLPEIEKQKKIHEGLINVRRFDLEMNLDKMESIYQRILS